MRAKTRHLWTAATFALYLACAAFVAIALAGAVSAQADSINIFAPYWLLGAMTALIVVILTERKQRRRRCHLRLPLALLGVFLLLGAFLLAPLASSPAAPSADRSYRLVSFNMYKANPEPERVADWLLSQNADLVVLLEVSPRNRTILDRLRPRFPFVYDCAKSGHCSTYLLSRFPAEDSWPLARGDADNREALSALTARFRLDGALVPITAVHLDRPWPLGNQQRELPALADALASVGREGVIAGDFNSAPWTFAARRLAAAANVHLVSGATGTWPSAGAIPRLPLDQLYAGPCIAARVARGPDLGSDHLPLIADIAPNACRG